MAFSSVNMYLCDQSKESESCRDLALKAITDANEEIIVVMQLLPSDHADVSLLFMKTLEIRPQKST